ncbi:TatD family hydrolase [Tomitella biformata]|uniref:TatD family hydrolase n=1 Tax=Tomitella biformata TaxID=630403 RepID=UPI0004658E07|nr:TatD family hydrolase [Tomitella biformata]
MAQDRPAPPIPEPVGELIDAHTHLDACGAHDQASVKEILDRAGQAGVTRVVTIADDLAAAQFAVRAANWDERVYAAVALHPTRANALDDAAKLELERLVQDPRVVAVGETGLDWYWPGKLEGCATREEQLDGFAWHIDLAKRVGKPLMIHNREADQVLLDVLKAEGAPETVIFHCFSSGPLVARQCVDAGYALSFSGTVSFKNAKALHESARLVPDAQLLVETDAPFLTPHPYRGAPNEPYCVPYTVRALAALREQDPAVVARNACENAERVYRIGSKGVS